MKGHLKKRSKDSWTIVFDLGLKANGKRNQKWKSIKGTKKEAEALLARMLTELEDGVYIDAKKTSVSDYLDKWIANIKGSVSSTTYERYKQLCEKHLKPTIGNIALNKLQAIRISELYSDAMESGCIDGNGGLSKQTVLHMHRVLKRALSQAVKWGLLSRNPCDAVDNIPKPNKKERLTFTTEETLSLLEQLEGNRLQLPVLLAVTTGMRRGEILGLRWKDIDLDKKRLYIRQIVIETRQYGLEVKQPKTDSSSRTIALPQITIDAIKKYRVEQAELCLQLGKGLTPESMLFNEYSGLNVPNRITVNFRSFIKSHGFKHVTFHDLRHTHATHLLEQNIHPKIVSERLGHSTIALTMNTYSHVMPTMQEEAANKVDELFGNSGK
ncbi:MAG: tyrosine-type recombinase/integrase [Proteobacteria bacterium]|nr:tyrosine-type recombinase/integrase [Pseudomonadota bacterium]